MDSSHRLKLDRAVEHLYALQAAAERWAQTDPCEVIEDCEIETRKHRVFVHLMSEPNDPLIPLRMADCIHNMRQALDHLAYSLAVRLHGCNPPPNEDNTGFPITTNATYFENAVYSKIAPKKLMPKALYTRLKAIQPHPGAPPYLRVLQVLDDLDKHRFLPVVAGVATGHTLNIEHFNGSYFSGPRLGILEPETPVIEYVPYPGTQVHMEFEFAGAITLGKSSTIAPGNFVLPLLSGIRMFILREVFPPLEEFL